MRKEKGSTCIIPENKKYSYTYHAHEETVLYSFINILYHGQFKTRAF